MPVIRDLRAAAQELTGNEALSPPVTPANLYRTVLLIELNFDGSEFLEVRFPHNPESWDAEYGARWRARGAPGVARDISDFEGFDPAQRSFQWLGEAKDPRQFESEFLSPLEGAMQLILDETQEAPRVQLLQGSHSIRGHMSQLSVRRVRTDPRGYARVAEISITITANDDQL